MGRLDIDGLLAAAEENATAVAARGAPWLAPLPTAYAVGRSVYHNLGWPVWVAVVAAAALELLALAALNTALSLRAYNARRRASDPTAPAAAAFGIVAGYLAVALLLTVVLDVFPSLARLAPAVFPGLSLAGVAVLALRHDHRARLDSVQAERAERQAQRQAQRQAERQAPRQTERRALTETVSKNGAFDTQSDRLQAGKKAAVDNRLDALLDILGDNPTVSVAAAARQMGISRQTVYTYIGQLESAGRLRRNGSGWEVSR